MKNINIRPLSAGDLTAAKDVINTTGLFPGEMLDEMAAPFLTGMASNDLWFVALDTQVVVGLVYCSQERMTDGTWNLLLIAVRESEQGQGVGSRLTRHLEQTLSQRNGRVLIVETSGLPDFDRTRAVYKRLDYVEVARIPEFYTAGEDKVVFWKLLPH
ncbi:GNAT family N-acetyltransferase [Brevundimonas sp. TWP2-3-2]|uniref:GNAT family N-acetyltransferase n=1 Tax=unclassified Brevundimonas TaxID=2622653 RepID=UPI003CF939F4